MADFIPHYLRRYRLRAALTQKEMAHLLGCQSPATVCQYEAHKQEPDPRTALAYQAVFGMPVEALFPGIRREVEGEVLIRAKSLSKQLTGAKATPALPFKRRAVRSVLAASPVKATDGEPQSNV